MAVAIPVVFNDMQRRRYLATIGATFALGAAGCLGDEDSTVDEDPEEVLDAARDHFAGLETVMTDDSIELDQTVSSEQENETIEMDITGGTTTAHDLEGNSFGMEGEGEVLVNGQSQEFDINQWFLEETLHILTPEGQMESHPEAEFGIGGDIKPVAFTDDTILSGEEITEQDGQYAIDISIDQDRLDEFFTGGVQSGAFTDVEFADFAHHWEIHEATFYVDPETDRFTEAAYDASLDLDADDLEDLGVELPAPDVEQEIDVSASFEFYDYDESVDISLPGNTDQN